MGSELLEKMLPAIERIPWPNNPAISELGLRSYEIALDEVDGFRGDPAVYRSALMTLQKSDCQPLAFAGVAYVVLHAAAEKDGSYVEEGLEECMAWLEKAQAIAPDLVEINFIEALVYVYGREHENARLVLDYLQENSEPYYRVMAAEVSYAHAVGDLEALEHWVEQASVHAANVPQRLRLLSKIADAYTAAGQTDKAIEQFRKAIHFDKANAELWHKLAVIYWRQENFEEAQRCNQQVLRLEPQMPAAQKMAQALKQKLDQGGGVLGKLFGRG